MARAPQIRFSAKDKFRLMNFVNAHFVNMSLGDAEFAQYAQVTIPLAGVNSQHIAETRKQLEIPSTRSTIAASRPSSLENVIQRLDALEKMINEIKARLDSVPLLRVK